MLLVSANAYDLDHGDHQTSEEASCVIDQNIDVVYMQSGYTDVSDLEGIRQRSIALDIPSAELLDSILEFANNVCGNHDDILASLPPVGAAALHAPLFSADSGNATSPGGALSASAAKSMFGTHRNLAAAGTAPCVILIAIL